MNENVYYSVEPYTGDIICHSGKPGMKWGFTDGVKNGLRVAAGKLNSAGQYVYDRARTGQLGSRTINNAKNIAGRIGSNASTIGRGVASGLKNAAKSAYDLYDTVSGRKKKRQNAAAKQARINAMTRNGKQWEYENKSLGGQLFKAKRGVNAAIGKAKDTMNRVGSTISSAPNRAKNAINSFIGNNITGQSRLGNNIDYIGNAVNTVKRKVKEGSKSDYKKRAQRIKSGYYD